MRPSKSRARTTGSRAKNWRGRRGVVRATSACLADLRLVAEELREVAADAARQDEREDRPRQRLEGVEVRGQQRVVEPILGGDERRRGGGAPPQPCVFEAQTRGQTIGGPE